MISSNGLGKVLTTKGLLDFVVGEKVAGASNGHRRKTFCTDPMGFSFVNKGRGTGFKRISDCRGLAVIQRLRSRAGYELLEITLSDLAQLYDRNTPGIDQSP